MKNCRFFKTVYANNNDALIPELWAKETLAILLENMVASNLVYREFKNEIANFGDVVNADRPNTFAMKRKTDADDVTIQDASATSIPVTLNQHMHTSFVIKDGERSKSFKDLVTYYLEPAVMSIAQGLDKVINGFGPLFLEHSFGQLEGMTSATVVADILGARKILNDNKVGTVRNALLTTDADAKFLANSLFTAADQVGDNGTALREASIGRKYGINWYMGQNTPYVDKTASDYRSTTVNNASGYPVGTTAITIAVMTGAVTAGEYITFEKSMYPYRIVSSTGGASPTAVVITPPLRDAIVHGDDVFVYASGLAEAASISPLTEYAAGWVKPIVIDGFTAYKAPQVGQIVAFGSNVYTIIEATVTAGATTGSFLLNRPLVATVADEAVACFGPAGSYNLIMAPQALALVSRPLAAPMPGTGALASVVSEYNMSVRVVITYLGTSQGHLVTVDMLCGVALLDVNQGCLLLG